MESDYQATLDLEAKKRYQEKLKLESEELADPYALSENEWCDDITKWPSVEYGDIYNYLIESKGRYTRQSLKAYKSLEAYNYFVSGHVRTVYYYESSTRSKYAVLKASVNPSQKSPSDPHEAWVIVHKENGQILSGHCKCKAGRGEVCSHVAALLFKLEAANRLGYNKPTCTSLPCSWNVTYCTKVFTVLIAKFSTLDILQVEPALVADIKFIKPNHKKSSEVSVPAVRQPLADNTQITQRLASNADNLYQALYAVVPSACIFTSVPIPEQELINEATVTSTPSESTVTSIPSESTVTSTPSESTVTSTQSESITSTPSESTVTNTSSQSTVTSMPSEATVTNTLSQSTVTSMPSEATVTSIPSEAIVTSMPSEVAEDSETSTNSVAIPAPLTTLHKDMYYNMANDELEKEAEKLFCSLSISEKEAEALVNATIMQQASAQWREQRNGCLTGSIFHDIYVRKKSTGPEPLIKRVMGYEQSDLSYVPAIKWGVENESVARQLYTNVMSTKHDNFACNLTGLWVSPLYPHLGASPDGVTTCGCHGDGLVEIKCPFSARHANSLSSQTCGFLTEAGFLDRKHRYYTQVQGQLMITDQLFCDFFIWTPLVHKVERIYPDVRFWETLEKKLTSFFVTNVLPEIMTHRLKEEIESDKENVYCVCRSNSAGRMIACDNRKCQYQWFHYSCIGMKRAPRGTWYCSDCKKVNVQNKTCT